MAITSLVLGILAFPGICCYGIPGLALGITAVVLGRISTGRIRNSYGNLGGGGLATAGWICGLIASIIAGIYFLVVVVFGVFSFFTFGNSPAFVTPSP